MRSTALAASAVACAAFGHASPLDTPTNTQLRARTLPNAPDGYAPATVDCPTSLPRVRSAQMLSSQETDFLEARRNNTAQPLQDLLSRIAIPGFDAGAYFTANRNNATSLPNVALAFSGGGYRAMFNGAGVLAAFDDRTPGSTGTGQLGGLLQASTYVAGLSGGNWLVGSIYANNFTSVQQIIDKHGQLWDISSSIIEGPPQTLPGILGTGQYYTDLVDQVDSKRDAGYNASLTDYWGRALSYQLIDAPDGGISQTFSSLQYEDFIMSATAPMPIVVADGRAPEERLITANATVYEFNPWEMGTWDPTAFGFVPLEYVGTNFTNGNVADGQKCVRGFDNAGFVMGTSSSLFNQIVLQFNSTVSLPDFIKNAIAGLLGDIDSEENDIADWTPNPFFGFNPGTNRNANSKRLTLVDGGEDLQNIPLQPLIQPNRNVDVIFAVDSSADTELSWPNGTSLVATYERSLLPIANGTNFPAVPDVNTFVNQGLNARPTFFGCNASNFSDSSPVPPLVVYLPNSYYSFASNFGTFNLTYNDSTRNAIIENGYDGATQGNGTLDADWSVCVGCAIMSRVWSRTPSADVPPKCTECFSRHCWDGTVNSTVPASTFNPGPRLSVTQLSGAALVAAPRLTGLVGAAAVAACSFLLM